MKNKEEPKTPRPYTTLDDTMQCSRTIKEQTS